MTRPRTNLPGWARYGLLLYLVVAMVWASGNLFVRWMGPCPAFSGNRLCSWGAAYEWWLFPVSQIVAVAIPCVFLKLMRKFVIR